MIVNIKEVKVWFEVTNGGFPRYVVEYHLEQGSSREQTLYDNNWGSELMRKNFGIELDWKSFMFFSDETLDQLKEVAKKLQGRKMRTITTKNNYTFLELI